VDLAKREVLLDHGRNGGLAGLYSVSGVKFTTAPTVARALLARIPAADARGRSVRPLILSTATSVLTDAARLLSMESKDRDAILRAVAAEEAVLTADDLVLRRTNWAVSGADVPRLQAWLDEHGIMSRNGCDTGEELARK
jgi:glycerol-3-phosphate dehydrogenase